MNPANEPSSSGASAASTRAHWREAIVLLAALASVALALRLGVWQLERAAQKIALQASLEARGDEPALAGPLLARNVDELPAQVYRRVHLVGRWAAARTVFLDNRQMDGKVGFFVVTPLRLDDSGKAVLVQRGWVPRHFDRRAALPVLVSPAGSVDVEGSVALAPSRMFEFSAAASGPIRQNVDVASFARETGLDLLPLAVIENANGSNSHDGLERHWPPPATDVQKHYGYAFQWFAIGTAIAFLYVWFRILRPRRRRRTE